MVCVFPLESFKELDFSLFTECSSSCVSFAFARALEEIAILETP